MSLERADAYSAQVSLHHEADPAREGPSTCALRIPAQEVQLIGTKAMLVARDDLSPAITNLLLDAAHELHSQQGYFAGVGEFPTPRLSTCPSPPTPAATCASARASCTAISLSSSRPISSACVVLLVPLLVIVVPLTNLLPQLFRWRVRSRIYRLYGE